VANPSGLLLGAVMMLVHIDQPDVATLVHNAWLRTIEEGIDTYDIYVEGVSRQKVGTKEFADAVIARLGQQPQILQAVQYKAAPKPRPDEYLTHETTSRKDLVGVDVYLQWQRGSAQELGTLVQQVNGDGLVLKAITNRGATVWPQYAPEVFCTDHWRCRFQPATPGSTIAHSQIISLLQCLTEAGFDFVHTENLYNFDGKPGFSAVAGE
jgi:isocitrate dehydrogenase